jgi:hydroxypyruvate isomerase
VPAISANLSMLFTEHAFLDRFDHAAHAGFAGVEYVGPYDFEAGEIRRRLRDNRLTQVLFNLPPGDWSRGERGIACHPDRMQEFRASVDIAINYAKVLDCRQVNCLAGITPMGVDALELEAVFIQNLKFAAAQMKAANVKLLIEPINTIDMPGFYLNTSSQALDVIAKVGSDNLFLQYDIYHMQIMEGDLARTIERILPWIAHMQAADNPGRNEPGTGEINFPFLFAFLDRIGYAGWVGAEYKPKHGTVEGLGWSRELLRPHKAVI